MRSTHLAALVAALAACGDSDAHPAADAAPPDAAVEVDGAGGCALGAGWSALPAVGGGAIQETAAVALAGKVYVLGGFDDSIGVVSTVRVFDPATCAWSMTVPLPQPLHHANAVVHGGSIYVAGAIEGTSFTAIGDVWSLDPLVDTAWTAHTAMPAGTARGAAVAGVIGERIYVAGGLAGGAVTTVSAYSIADDRWETDLPPLPQPVDHGCGGVVDGKLYVVGGRNGNPSANASTVYEYTPGGAWVAKAPMPTARGGTACGIHAGRIVVAGGEGNDAVASGVFPDVEAYTVETDAWSALPAMRTPRHGMAGAVIGSAFFVPGGATQELFGAVDTHEALAF